MAFRAATKNDTVTAGASVVNKPTGTVDGDLVLLWTVSDSSTSVAPTWPSGFVEDSLSPVTTGVLDAQRLRWAWKIASGEGASWTITSPTDGVLLGAASWSGRSSATPHRISSLADTTSRASVWTGTSSAFSSNTTLAGCDIGFLMADDVGSPFGNVSHGAPSGFTKQIEHVPGVGGAHNSGLSTKDNAAAGETGAYAGTGTLAGANTNLALVAFALAPSAPVVPPPRIARIMSPQQRMG